ncbi:Plasmid stabilization system protein [Symmachiella dynata]|uniref:Plasmid stabilization system protein n=1 Tax=Symmachiella dynata TaxID=2527995 RepID=A0A517ZK56_9PLAN|nr:type II toxin-antitoxin system RelE/ParE family toxin [Symmachiella dynata]QDU42879.1 Plasmid stabilization system protein [Symmachiella dynata]
MAYTVEFSARARRDIDEIVAYIQADSPRDATRWRQKLQERMNALRTMPEACGLAPENDESPHNVRQLLHGHYRVLFTIREQRVFVLTIRHGARRFMKAAEFDAIK